MKLDLGSFAFGSSVTSGGNTPSWGTSLGQKKPDLKLTYPGFDNIIVGMMYKSIPVDKVYIPLGKGGHVCNSLEDEGIQLAAMFDKVYVNEVKVNSPFIMLIYRDSSDRWDGRRTLKYNTKIEYRRGKNDIVYNSDFVDATKEALHLNDDACWVVSDIFIVNQDELHLVAGIVNSYKSETFPSSELRKAAFLTAIKTTYDENPHFAHKYAIENLGCIHEAKTTPIPSTAYRPYITAIKSKPFLLLAGISGTGKSRIVRELARACWEEGSEEYKAQKPRNFAMVQVKPNWHDSSELIGYVSRVSGKAEFVAGDFLKFVAKAWEDQDTPYFLCLDEMNLAPVEQYFAEYLSVVESRKCGEDGVVTTDPILNPEYEAKRNEKTGELEPKAWYKNLVDELLSKCPTEKLFALTKQFMDNGICIPQNLIVVGTVNMDETTFSFSRKVLDRAMTIEMNDVNLHGGLTKRHESIGKLGKDELVGTAVEGVDVYSDYTSVCDTALGYLQKVNDVLEGTPFKIAYRTRNEFLLYVVNNLPYNKDKDGNDLPQGYVIARALDEITSMKILSRIEGDDTKVKDSLLNALSQAIADGLNAITDEEHPVKSVSVAKLDEMKNRLQSGYTSFWS